MKRKAFSGGFLLALSLLLLSGCQPAANENVAPAPNTNREEVTVDRAAIEAELLRIENDWPRVIREKDVAAVRKIEADDGIFIYPNGDIGDKARDIKDMETGALTADSWEVVDLKVNVLDADAAIVSGRSIVKNGKYKMPDGKSMDISGQYRFLDTFVKRSGEWKLVAGAGVPIAQPMASSSPSPMASPAAKASPTMKASPASTPSPAVKSSPTATP